MAIPLPGTYRLRNVAFPNQMFTLTDGGIAAGTPVIGLTNDPDNQAMLWTMQVVNLADNLVRLINVASGTFAQVTIPEAGQAIVGDPGPAAVQFRIIPRPHVGEFAIQTIDGFNCSLADPLNHVPVLLQDANGLDAKQAWIFAPA